MTLFNECCNILQFIAMSSFIYNELPSSLRNIVNTLLKEDNPQRDIPCEGLTINEARMTY